MKSAVSPIPQTYRRFLAVAEATRRRPTALSAWLFVAPQTLRRSSWKNPALQAVVSVASRLCDEAKPGQILISPRVLMKVENAEKVEPVGEFELKGIRRPLAAYNVVDALSRKPE
jgi:hypothetical protein